MYDVKIPNVDWLGQRGDLDRMFAADPSEEQGLILFYGPSNFTRWNARWGNRPLEEDIRRKDGARAAVNHGFGGATSEELLYYYGRLVRPWNPRALVLAGGFGNGLPLGYGAGETMALTARILDWARHDFPGIRLYLCNGYPNPRVRTPAAALAGAEYRELVRDYCLRHDDTAPADCTAFPGFWQEGHMGDFGYPRPGLFVEDDTHFNQAGYDVYRDFFLHVLDDIL